MSVEKMALVMVKTMVMSSACIAEGKVDGIVEEMV